MQACKMHQRCVYITVLSNLTKFRPLCTSAKKEENPLKIRKTFLRPTVMWKDASSLSEGLSSTCFNVFVENVSILLFFLEPTPEAIKNISTSIWPIQNIAKISRFTYNTMIIEYNDNRVQVTNNLTMKEQLHLYVVTQIRDILESHCFITML